jgi:GNAT superfamily N-acetyltransferase
MSSQGRPKGEYRSAQHEGGPVSSQGRPKGEHRSVQREGKPGSTVPAARRSGNDAPAQRPRTARRPGPTVVVRPVRQGDLDHVVAIDARVTGQEKRAYWQSLDRRYGVPAKTERQFLVADAGGRVVGFVIGEVRDWEFGSPPCGWVFAINVEPGSRLAGVGTRLLAAIYAGFRRAGVRTVRTMLARDNNLVLSFFRSQGMMTGPFVPLEIDLAETD